MDDITDGPLNGDEYINPFKKHPYYTNHSYYCGEEADAPDLKDIANNVEVMVYYEKEDGTRIESPRVRAVDVSGVNDIQADPITTPTFGTDDKIYDLTGRIVIPDNLSPGIYIRNGRKFLVR